MTSTTDGANETRMAEVAAGRLEGGEESPERTKMTIRAKYASRCKRCGGQIKPGEQVEWERGVKGVSHATCPSSPEPAEAREGYGRAWPANGRQRGLSCAVCDRGLRDGEEVRYHYLAGESKSRRIEHVECPSVDAEAETPATEPIALVRGGAQQPAGRNRRPGNCDTCGTRLPAGAGRLVRCYADTGCMEHFDDDGWHVYCLDEEACKARVESARAEREAREEAGAKRAAALRAVRAEFDERGESPDSADGQVQIEGEEIALDSGSTRIYGGGEWVVVADDRLWLVRNNGADGDNWAVNNVGTGGAGAIGRSLPRTPELEARCRELACG